MLNNGILNLNLNSILKWLFCFYAFALSFELFFEVYFNIDTIFKPFRLVALLIIGVYAIKVLRSGWKVKTDQRSDVFFYLMILTGILISYFRILSGPFNMALFYNDLFLVGLNVIVFFIFKQEIYTPREMLQVLYFFISGVLCNGLFIFYSYFFVGIVTRQAGFMDNPNYAALASSAALTFLVLSINHLVKARAHILAGLSILFLGYIFLITGSRSGLIILVFSLFLVFLFSTFYRKVAAVAIVLVFSLFLLPRNMEQLQIGGPLVLVKRINKKMDQGEADVRFVLWNGVFRMLETEGYMGMGIGQYKEKFEQYFSTSSHLYIINIVERGYFLSTHNDYLAILTDYGVVALLFYLGFLVISFLKLLRKVLYPDEDDEMRFINRYQFILVCSLAIFGLASENLASPLFWFLMMVATKEVNVSTDNLFRLQEVDRKEALV